ncbi:helix-turn-helix domain-containing protein [Halosimplex halophilum]|uniref:helix-turn-helix domain-containing protein n=1 Tax=Halosimplex halophilum TaxID=2559572 RepID=UPI00107FCC42|nr:multiprotein-bridging factor 1 family protein [Halosimplex halophilum]
MAKYSTGGAGSSASDSCELCGAENVDLQTASVAGATLSVCSECAQHDETPGGGSDDGGSSRDERDRKRQAAQNAARMQDAASADAGHWEDGADYDDDQLPYLVSDYGDVLVEARQDAGLQTEELAEAVDADESDVLAVEQGRATQANVGGSLIAALEGELDVQLVDSE